ncbi:putative L,D-transpeptidase YkuD [Novipirellula aureliae]|uniref:Putative L,D-transpeptidase YkuD n=1 Tax=Novipirellula aureliae TaxID=2527966 RepID=A0A5C6DVI1_9BACT|nr:L,D-transpeptidase family protein [Novipirellula aureliae]TWU41383.1 putative L,D-transpeptidase YkuD [Novipirellula aureliae]
MQTVKTAAIVVLLMTVMYAAYTSLTTPPDSLPPEISKLVIDEGGFDIESGLPDSLAALDVDPGTPQPSTFADSEEIPTFGASFDDSIESSTETYTFDEGVSAQLSDAEQGSDLTVRQPGEEENRPRASVQASLASATSRSGSTPTGTSTPIEYPSTGMSFELPMPDAPDGSNGDPIGIDSTPMANLPPVDIEQEQSSVERSNPSDSALAEQVSAKPNRGLANAIQTADAQYAADQRKEALATLSLFYNTPNLSQTERSEMLGRLDALAAEVIYSKQHLLEQPYRVGHHETLMQIAVRYEVPWQLLANINGVDDPITVLPGTELKVVRGPFRAEVNLSTQELTLFLGDLYAGRFPIAVGNDPTPKAGTFTIQDKQAERTFYDANGNSVPAGDPNNPYGTLWLDLGSQLCIHGSPYATKPTPHGCISVASDYADDLYGILTQGSSVTIRR